jgi:hypothetical protein
MARNVLDLNISNISMDPHTMKWLQNTTQMHDTLTIIDGPGPSPCKTPNSQSDPPCPSHLHSRGMLKCIVGNRTAPPLHSQLPLLTSRERQPSLGAWRRAFSTTSGGDGGEGRMMVARGGWCCLEPRNQWSFGSGFYWWTSLTSRVVSGFAWFALDSKPEGWKIEHAWTCCFWSFLWKEPHHDSAEAEVGSQAHLQNRPVVLQLIVHVFLYLDVRFPPIVGGYSHVCSWQPHLP